MQEHGFALSLIGYQTWFDRLPNQVVYDWRLGPFSRQSFTVNHTNVWQAQSVSHFKTSFDTDIRKLTVVILQIN